MSRTTQWGLIGLGAVADFLALNDFWSWGLLPVGTVGAIGALCLIATGALESWVGRREPTWRTALWWIVTLLGLTLLIFFLLVLWVGLKPTLPDPLGDVMRVWTGRNVTLKNSDGGASLLAEYALDFTGASASGMDSVRVIFYPSAEDQRVVKSLRLTLGRGVESVHRDDAKEVEILARHPFQAGAKIRLEAKLKEGVVKEFVLLSAEHQELKVTTLWRLRKWIFYRYG